MQEAVLTLFLIVVVLYAGLAAWLGRLSITMPMVFVIFGALMGPEGLGLITLTPTAGVVELLAELTLALLLFADASMLDLRQVRQDSTLPGRLLLLGMPLAIAFGAAIAFMLFPSYGLGFALLLGAILAPTDAALGLPIFTNKRIPVRIRRALNVESGLNDGIASPFVTLFIALTLAEEGIMLTNWLQSALQQIGLAVLAGIVVAIVGGRFLMTAAKRGWSSGVSERVGILAIALTAFFLSQAIGGNGFVAAFTGGLVFGSVTRSQLAEETEFTEATGTLFSLLVWTLFASSFVIPAFRATRGSLGFRPVLYALLSLTVVRLASTGIALAGTHLRRDTVALMGWFGPRGLAAVVFGLLAFDELQQAPQASDLLAVTFTWTVLLSVLAHGLSANPLVNWYAGRLDKAEAGGMELEELPELQPRRRMLTHVDVQR